MTLHRCCVDSWSQPAFSLSILYTGVGLNDRLRSPGASEKNNGTGAFGAPVPTRLKSAASAHALNATFGHPARIEHPGSFLVRHIAKLNHDFANAAVLGQRLLGHFRAALVAADRTHRRRDDRMHAIPC